MPFGAAITGIGTYVPERRLTNADLCQMVETDDEWIVTRTGIHERRIAPPEEGTSHLATRAAQEALANADLAPGDIDLILVATSTPDMLMPPTAALVQGNLGATRAAAFDLNGVCAGFLYALATGAQFVQNGAYRHVLVIGADTFSRLLDYKDRTTCILFGDGAGAVVLSRSETDAGLLDFVLKADGTESALIQCPSTLTPAATRAALNAGTDPYFTQNGRSVFKLAVSGMAGACQEILERQGLSADQVRAVVPHQANQRIMTAVAERIGVPAERVANCIAEYGNTSAATIPLALQKWLATDGLKPGDLVLLTAFGSGLLWGAALLRWGK